MDKPFGAMENSAAKDHLISFGFATAIITYGKKGKDYYQRKSTDYKIIATKPLPEECLIQITEKKRISIRRSVFMIRLNVFKSECMKYEFFIFCLFLSFAAYRQ